MIINSVNLFGEFIFVSRGRKEFTPETHEPLRENRRRWSLFLGARPVCFRIVIGSRNLLALKVVARCNTDRTKRCRLISKRPFEYYAASRNVIKLQSPLRGRWRHADDRTHKIIGNRDTFIMKTSHAKISHSQDAKEWYHFMNISSKIFCMYSNIKFTMILKKNSLEDFFLKLCFGNEKFILNNLCTYSADIACKLLFWSWDVFLGYI